MGVASDRLDERIDGWVQELVAARLERRLRRALPLLAVADPADLVAGVLAGGLLVAALLPLPGWAGLAAAAAGGMVGAAVAAAGGRRAAARRTIRKLGPEELASLAADPTLCDHTAARLLLPHPPGRPPAAQLSAYLERSTAELVLAAEQRADTPQRRRALRLYAEACLSSDGVERVRRLREAQRALSAALSEGSLPD